MKKKILVCDFPANWDTCMGDDADWCKHHKRLPHYEFVEVQEPESEEDKWIRQSQC